MSGDKSPQHHLYCICGAAVHAYSEPAAGATMIVDWFLGKHRGEGHGLTDSRGASRGRARRDREDARLAKLLGGVLR